MDTRKNKVFLASIVIVGAIIVIVFVLNKFNIVQKVERFVDDEEEGYEDEEEDGENDEQETFAEKATDSKTSKPTSKPTPSTLNKPEAEKSTTKEVRDDVQPINDISAKFRKLIDEMDKQLKNKAVSDDIKKKVMTELMGSIESFNKLGDDTSNIISSVIHKYIPKQDKDHYADAPVAKSMVTIKNHLKQALEEIERMESSNSTMSVTSKVNERFVQSTDVAPAKHSTVNDDVVEGFENTPNYALY